MSLCAFSVPPYVLTMEYTNGFCCSNAAGSHANGVDMSHAVPCSISGLRQLLYVQQFLPVSGARLSRLLESHADYYTYYAGGVSPHAHKGRLVFVHSLQSV